MPGKDVLDVYINRTFHIFAPFVLADKKISDHEINLMVEFFKPLFSHEQIASTRETLTLIKEDQGASAEVSEVLSKVTENGEVVTEQLQELLKDQFNRYFDLDEKQVIQAFSDAITFFKNIKSDSSQKSVIDTIASIMRSHNRLTEHELHFFTLLCVIWDFDPLVYFDQSDES